MARSCSVNARAAGQTTTCPQRILAIPPSQCIDARTLATSFPANTHWPCSSGIPNFDQALAKNISEFGVPCFGCTPNKLPELIEGVLKKQDLKALAARVAAKKEKAAV